ncbi:MAG: 1-acyl-sn-glycerol-3-phosphate acyltransferase [Bacteroidales bacterium]|nr:1-acyl-sn-glycerol-3-phosphate acyltransferase [Lachnoclostridium sp.]MCM1384710.1 1-acyl-sn-glycerol-3-phosphate acyltransferase [Lachnoclostridium sp.]MCM1465276.1 1-acyl-sn-glycerol-3-phosphate acyltransferase [Bacteroidales bacterium]
MKKQKTKKQKAEEAFTAYQHWKREQVQHCQKIKYSTFRKCIRPFLRILLFGQRKICGFEVEVLNRACIKGKEPVIFAVTHIGKWDFEIVNEQITKPFYVIASDFLNTYGAVGGYFFRANGVVWVNETSREDKANTKEMMKQILKQGENIMIFPEGTWNLSENEPICDIAYGTADVAIETGAKIIPIAVEQYTKRFVINMGQPIFHVEVNDKKHLTAILRDTLATLKWEIWEREGISSRAELPADYWEKFIDARLKEWPGYSMKEQIVNRFLPKEKLEYWQIQRDLKTGLLPRWYEMVMQDEGKIRIENEIAL